MNKKTKKNKQIKWANISSFSCKNKQDGSLEKWSI